MLCVDLLPINFFFFKPLQLKPFSSVETRLHKFANYMLDNPQNLVKALIWFHIVGQLCPINSSEKFSFLSN